MSKIVLFSAVIVALMSMYQPVNSFGLVRVDIQKDPAYVNAISSAISSKIQSLNSILSSLLALKSSYKTVTINGYGSGSSSGSSSSGSSSGSSSSESSNGSSNVVYNTIPLYRKTVNVNYGVVAAPVANTIEESSDDVDDAPTTSNDNSVSNAGSTIFTATKIIGGVAAPAAPSSVSTTSDASSGSASVASPSSSGYSYTKVIT